MTVIAHLCRLVDDGSSSCSHQACAPVFAGYGLDLPQSSTRAISIGYLSMLERLLQVLRLQVGCVVRVSTYTAHGGSGQSWI